MSHAITYRPIAELAPYARNARTHSDAQVAQLASAIEEFGWTNPVLADASGIVAGHGRVMAAQRLYARGLRIKTPGGVDIPDGTVPTIDCTGWSEPQRRAYILADNQLALQAGWDEQLLAQELADLQALDCDLSLTGFAEDELSRLLAGLEATEEGQTDEDAIPEQKPDVAPVSRPGDVWRLGLHRIMCGDSTSTTDVERLLAGAKPHLMVTDPPYGVEYDPEWRNEAERANGEKVGAMATGVVLNDDKADWREAWALFPGEVAYVWHAGIFAGEVQDSLKACNFEIRCQIIWGKPRFAISRGHYHWQHEPCLYAVRRGGVGHWQGDRSQTTLWTIAHNKSETGHGTQKPVEAMLRPIQNNSQAGDAVYEPFSGSGTTIIACEKSARRCYAMELNPAYVDIAVRRWQQFTGKRATLEATGEPFPEVVA
jgi:DNA modification methylase